MSTALKKRCVEAGSLIRREPDIQDFPSLNTVAEGLIRGLREINANYGLIGTKVSVQNVKTMCFGEWLDSAPAGTAVCKYRSEPLKGNLAVGIPIKLIMSLVDTFYGGSGNIEAKRTELTPSETTFLERFGSDFGSVITAAWSDTYPLAVAIESCLPNLKRLTLVKKADQVVVQRMDVASDTFDTLELDIVYAASMLQPLSVDGSGKFSSSGESDDSLWRQRIRDALLEVHLPVRTIFARKEMSFSELFALKPGDVIPVCLPKLVPVTIGGLPYAEGVIGESNGRSSIRIDKLNPGKTNV
jgi:flagellar motor switch protein FliM